MTTTSKRKGDWHESGLVTDQGHDRPGQLGKKRGNEMERGPSKHRSSDARQLGCVFQDMKPPKSSSSFRKSSDVRKPIRCVQFTKAVVRHANIRDQNTSLGMICPGDPHQRNPNGPTFEDWSQEETEWQERCAREAAWKLAKKFLKFKEKDKQHSSQEREFVVDSGASMHMISKKGLE